ncbi:hypothetical protein CSV74_13710 [Sporosarcina sp. P19]|nr:hypothetical protein CSV74_13710 [Sporosarcina sp. P19]
MTWFGCFLINLGRFIVDLEVERLNGCWGEDLRYGGDAFLRARGEPTRSRAPSWLSHLSSQPGRELPLGCLTCRADPLGVAPPTRKSLQCKWVAIRAVHYSFAWLLGGFAL